MHECCLKQAEKERQLGFKNNLKLKAAFSKMVRVMQ